LSPKRFSANLLIEQQSIAVAAVVKCVEEDLSILPEAVLRYDVPVFGEFTEEQVRSHLTFETKTTSAVERNLTYNHETFLYQDRMTEPGSLTGAQSGITILQIAVLDPPAQSASLRAPVRPAEAILLRSMKRMALA
jgi:hypothetical protein